MTREQLRFYRLHMKLSYADIASMLGNVPAVTADDIQKMENGSKAMDSRLDSRFKLPPHIAELTPA